jgi:hypothetical protein
MCGRNVGCAGSGFAGFDTGFLNLILRKNLIRNPFVGLCTFPQFTTSYYFQFLRHAALVDAVRDALPGPRSPRAIKVYTVPPNICGSSVTFLTPRSLRWLVDFEKIVYLSINDRVQENVQGVSDISIVVDKVSMLWAGRPGVLA